MDDDRVTTDPDRACYEIRVRGQLATHWAARFDGLTLTPLEDGTTVLRGPVADQAALHGLLRQLADIGIPLLSLHRQDRSTDTTTDTTTATTTTPGD
ncbi:hypothetical protein [Terrabacter sp. 2RAF25]|uniref:hypothetical protein n=1 Tax=Terrabacter sp. 2RAF25 TaxID=3232998 RepID=UPI003F94E0EA